MCYCLVHHPDLQSKEWQAALSNLRQTIDHGDGNQRTAAQPLQEAICWAAKQLGGPAALAKIKHALSRRLPGYPEQPRLPLVPLNAGERKRVDAFVEELETKLAQLIPRENS